MANYYTMGIGQPHTEADDKLKPVCLDENGVTLYAGDNPAVLPSPRLKGNLYVLQQANNPFDIGLYGDSTGNDTTEWFYKLGQRMSTGFASAYSVAYRLFSDANQCYSAPEYITTGPLGRRYISAGSASTSHYVSLTSSTALNIAGDLTVAVRLNTNGITAFGGAFSIASKFTSTGNQRAWRFDFNASGTLLFGTSPDGTNETTSTSTVSAFTIPEVIAGEDIWLSAAIDVDNGASGRTVNFYYSTDGATWTALGDPVVTGSTTSIYANTAAMTFIGRNGGGISSVGRDLKFYEMRVWADLTRSDSRAWVDAGSIPQRTSVTSIAYNDDCGNDGTIAFQASTVVGSPRLCLFNGSVGGQDVTYASDATRFPKLNAGFQQIVYISYSHNAANDVTYRPEYKALTDLIVAATPDAAIMGVLQNKRYSPAGFIWEHELRKQQIAAFCASQGFDVFNLAAYVTEADMNADGIHPLQTAAVQDPIADAAYRQLAFAVGQAGA